MKWNSDNSRAGRDFLRLYLSLLVPTVLLTLVLSTLYYRQDMGALQREREKEGAYTVQRQREAVEDKVRSIAVGLALAANSQEFLAVVNRPGNQSFQFADEA